MTINSLAGALVGKFHGPALVCGGAPRLLEDLAILEAGKFDFEKCLIVSANEHAIHAGLKPHYAVVNDDRHSMSGELQEPRMRKLMPETKLLSRHWWADYRSPNLMACNSGIKAILYAALLGANPVITAGFDHYRTKDLYHHNKSPKSRQSRGNPNQARPLGHFTSQVKRVMDLLKGRVPVRSVGGPMTQQLPRWQPDEVFLGREYTQLEIEASNDAKDTCSIIPTQPGMSWHQATVPFGVAFAVTRHEMKEAVASGSFIESSQSLAEHEAAMLAEHRRDMRRVEKARSSSRAVRRGITDGDLLRFLRRFEAGVSEATIAGECGLPVDQIRHLIAAMTDGEVDRTPSEGVGSVLQSTC